MTCKCGYEMCWHCGGSYTKHGRRGHSTELFPAPSQLKYCCNGWKQWSQRAGVVTLAIPAAGIAIGATGAALALAIPGIPLLMLAKGIKNKNRQRRQRRLQAARQQHRLKTLFDPSYICQGYHEATTGINNCKHCAGVACFHIYRHTDEAEVYVCTLCDHVSMPLLTERRLDGLLELPSDSDTIVEMFAVESSGSIGTVAVE